MSEVRGASSGGLPLQRAPRPMALHGARPAAAKRQSLEEACAAVEGLFLSQLLSQLEIPAFGGGMLGQSAAQRLFGAQRSAALGVELGKRCELGLAQMLRSQLELAMAGARSSERDESSTDATIAGSEQQRQRPENAQRSAEENLRLLPLTAEYQGLRGEEVTRP